jgi:hypothetical protein
MLRKSSMLAKRPRKVVVDDEEVGDDLEAIVDENERLRIELQNANKSIAQLTAELAVATGGQPRRRVQLVHLPNIPKGMDLELVDAPRRFSAADSFPHAVVKLENDARMYEVEARRKCQITFQARFLDGTPATEYDIDPSGSVRMRMRLYFANDMSEVQPGNFAHLKLGALVEPKAELENSRLLVRGEVSFLFRCLFTSSDSRPRLGSQFVVQVEAEGHEGVVARSVPFTVKSKVTAPREKPAATEE